MFVQQVLSVIPCDVSCLSEHPVGVSTGFTVLSQWAPSQCVHWVYHPVSVSTQLVCLLGLPSCLSDHPADMSAEFTVLSQWVPIQCVYWIYPLASGNLYQLIPKVCESPLNSCPAGHFVGQEFLSPTKLRAVMHHMGFLSFLSRHRRWKTLTQKHFQHEDPLDETDGQSVGYKVKGLHRPFYITALNDAWHTGAGYVCKGLTNRMLRLKT